MTLEIPNIITEQDNNPWGQADDNVVQTFQIESSQLRGRIVRLGRVLDDILAKHDYPDTVAHLVAETLTLAVLLSSMMKYEGIFTLQTKGDGPVSMLVADVTSGGDVRACASFDTERLIKAQEQIAALEAKEGNHNHLAQYLGKGYIAFTVDQGDNTETYQGIVELKGASMVDCVHHYFTQSEQLRTGIKMAAGLRDGQWRAGGIMLQHLPEKEAETRVADDRENEWRHAMVLMESGKEDELLSPTLHSNELLLRLFHEDGVRVYTPIALQEKCRCNPDKIEKILLTMSEDNINYLSDDGEIKMNCEFCNRDYVFKQKTLLRKMKKHNKSKNTENEIT